MDSDGYPIVNNNAVLEKYRLSLSQAPPEAPVQPPARLQMKSRRYNLEESHKKPIDVSVFDDYETQAQASVKPSKIKLSPTRTKRATTRSTLKELDAQQKFYNIRTAQYDRDRDTLSQSDITRETREQPAVEPKIVARQHHLKPNEEIVTNLRTDQASEREVEREESVEDAKPAVGEEAVNVP